MKYLSDYTQEKQTALFEETGTFFAFSTKQFHEKKKDGVIYVNMGYGMLCPKEHSATINDRLAAISEEARAQDVAENGIDKIIRRELANYETQIDMDLDDARSALKPYGVTEEQLQAGWKKFYAECVKNDWF